LYSNGTINTINWVSVKGLNFKGYCTKIVMGAGPLFRFGQSLFLISSLATIHDDKMIVWWRDDSTMVTTWCYDVKITISPSYHRVFTIGSSRFYLRSISFSPSVYRVFKEFSITLSYHRLSLTLIRKDLTLARRSKFKIFKTRISS
jgi:hypothetical protein